jgi:hypothetical protein
MFYHAECEYAIRNKKINVRLVRCSEQILSTEAMQRGRFSPCSLDIMVTWSHYGSAKASSRMDLSFFLARVSTPPNALCSAAAAAIAAIDKASRAL